MIDLEKARKKLKGKWGKKMCDAYEAMAQENEELKTRVRNAESQLARTQSIFEEGNEGM